MTESTASEKSLIKAILQHTGKPMHDDVKWFAGELAKLRPNGTFRLSEPFSRFATGSECYFRYILKDKNDNSINVNFVIETQHGTTQSTKLELQTCRVGYRGGHHYDKYNYAYNHYQTRFTFDRNIATADPNHYLEKFETIVINQLELAELKRQRKDAASLAKQAKIDANYAKLKAELFKEHGLTSNAKTELGFTIATRSGSDKKIKATFKEMLPLLV